MRRVHKRRLRRALKRHLRHAHRIRRKLIRGGYRF